MIGVLIKFHGGISDLPAENVGDIKGGEGHHEGVEVLLDSLPREDEDGAPVAEEPQEPHCEEQDSLKQEGEVQGVVVMGTGLRVRSRGRLGAEAGAVLQHLRKEWDQSRSVDGTHFKHKLLYSDMMITNLLRVFFFFSKYKDPFSSIQL